MSNKFYPNAGHFYSNYIMPVKLDCGFTVAPANGLGITGLTGSGIANVFMHTSTTPATGNRSALNPNPADGIIVVQLGDNYNSYLGGNFQVQDTISGGNVTTTVANTAYIITSVGTTNTAQWVAVGLPIGVTPAVGAAFVAIASQAIGGTGVVKAQANAGIVGIEVLGNPNATLAPLGVTNPKPAPGGQIILQCLGATSSSVTTLIPVAPTTGSLITLSFILSNSSAAAGSAG